MQAQKIIQFLLQNRNRKPHFNTASAFAPTNIALIKYWGKRDRELNLPLTNSLSITLPSLGAHTTLTLNNTADEIILNGAMLDPNDSFAKRAISFLNLFRIDSTEHFTLETTVNIPVAAGLASSAAGFAALVRALDTLYQWQLSEQELSVLARLGSGSACRSFWHGFVEWQAGNETHGLDSHAYPLDITWPQLRVGIVLLDSTTKKISSRDAMQTTVETSKLFKRWPAQVAQDLATIKMALKEKNFILLGTTAENNALSMHATMEDATPSISYSSAETLQLRKKIWHCRSQGLPVFFTQDAGPNLKLLFLERDRAAIEELFPDVIIVAPFIDCAPTRGLVPKNADEA